MPLLAHPRLERVLGATSAMLAFGGVVLSFLSHFLGFGRNLPHVLVGQQLGACLPIHEKRPYSFLHPAPSSCAFGASRLAIHGAFTSATHDTGTIRGRTLFLYLFFHGLRPRARPRPRPRRGGGGLGSEVRVEVRRTEGRPPPSSYTVVTVLVCLMLRIRLPRARC